MGWFEAEGGWHDVLVGALLVAGAIVLAVCFFVGAFVIGRWIWGLA